MIEINNISKVFRTSEVETVALNHVNLEVIEGEFVAIMGPSGCGKSTLLNILGLLDNPTEGSYRLMGEEVGGLKEKERTHVRKGKLGFVFQSFNLIDELNVYENVELPLTYLGYKASARRRMVEDILKRMNIWFAGLTTKADSISVCRLPFSLSGLPEAEILFLQF